MGQSKAYSIVYYVDGLLIDTGHHRKKNKIIEAVKDFDVNQIFITHHHEDHTGNSKELKALFGCDVYASQHCCELMKNPPALSFAQKLYWGPRPAQHDFKSVGKKLKTKQFEFELIPIPGHAPDMMALYEPERKWLFSADLFIHHRIGYFMTTESMKTQMDSLRKVLSYDFDVLFCAHNPQLQNGKQRLKDKLDYFEGFFDQVTTLHEKGMGEKEIFKTLQLSELKMIKLLSRGYLSKMNMVRSVIRDIGG